MPSVCCSACEKRFVSPEPLRNQMCPRCGIFFDATKPPEELSEKIVKVRYYRKLAVWLDVLAIVLPVPTMLLALFAFSLLDGVPYDIYEKILTIVYVFLGVSAMIGVWVFCVNRCPVCRMHSPSFRHSRKDGQADRRFKDNPLVCSYCDWRSID